MCLESCKTTKYPVLTEVETCRSRTPCQRSLPGPPPPGPCSRWRRAPGVSGLRGSSALWVPGREVPTTPTASRGQPGGSGLFTAFPSIFVPFDPSRGCCFEAQQISACSLSGRDSPPGPGEGCPLPAGRGPGAHLPLPSESLPPAPCTRTPQMTPGNPRDLRPPAPLHGRGLYEEGVFSLSFLSFQTGDLALGAPRGWHLFLRSHWGDFSHAPKPCPCLQMAKIPMLTGIWGSLPNLRSGGSAELATSFLLGVRLGLEGSQGGPVSCSSTPRGRLPPCPRADQSGGLCCVPDTSMERTAGLGWGEHTFYRVWQK